MENLILIQNIFTFVGKYLAFMLRQKSGARDLKTPDGTWYQIVIKWDLGPGNPNYVSMI